MGGLESGEGADVGVVLLRELLGHVGDAALVFAMDVDHCAELAGLLHAAQVLGCVFVELDELGHEDLEAGVAVGDGVPHFGQRVLAGLEDGRVKTVVDHGLLAPLVPADEAVLERLTGFGDGIVADRRDAAAGRLDRGRVEVVGGRVPHPLELDMGVHVDAAGEQDLAAAIDGAPGRPQAVADLLDDAALDPDVGVIALVGSHDLAVRQNQVHLPLHSLYLCLHRDFPCSTLQPS